MDNYQWKNLNNCGLTPVLGKKSQFWYFNELEFIHPAICKWTRTMPNLLFQTKLNFSMTIKLKCRKIMLVDNS